jgi:hypothetical protein
MTIGSNSGALATVVVLVAMQRRWKYPWWDAPSAAMMLPPVKSPLGCAWLAARALPRHALQVGAWAEVCLPSLSLTLSPSPSVTSLWSFRSCFVLLWLLVPELMIFHLGCDDALVD